MTRLVAVSTFACAALAAALGLPGMAGAQQEPVRASAVITSCTGDPAVKGRMQLVERPSVEGVKLVDVTLEVQGLPDGRHAVHIHEAGNCTPCSEAKGHFDPGPAGKSAPDGNHPFHSGDLINLEVKGATGTMQTITSRITLSPGPLSVFDKHGSSVIIHADPDTYCPEGEIKGCAGGARLACGVIEVEKP
jgi:Cu-Zn family superoxide dismutase